MEVALATITNFFGITGDVPFVELDVDSDNRQFLDLSAVRRCPESSWRETALREADGFLAQLAGFVLTGDRRGITMLDACNEIWYTRLGLSQGSFTGGRGAATVRAEQMWEVLCKEDRRALLDLCIFKRLEHFPIFVDGVGGDVTSDVTTRVIFRALAEFTAAMMIQYPQLRLDAAEVSVDLWDAGTASWESRTFLLPTAGGKTLLLIPKGWTRSNLTISGDKFHSKTVLDRVQEATAVVSADGKVHKPRKRDLQRLPEYSYSRDANVRATLEAAKDRENLVEVHEEYVNSAPCYQVSC